MSYPYLIARTPRAGRHNHVTLLPTEELPRAFQPSDFLGTAARLPTGANYVGVSRTVPQADSAREGRETLVLAGVRPPSDPQARAVLTRWLVESLDSVGRLVEGTDWASHDGSPLRVPQLAQWKAECVARFGLIAYPGECTRPHVIPKSRSLRMALILIALVAIGSVVGFLVGQGSGAVPRPTVAFPTSVAAETEIAWRNLSVRGGTAPGDPLIRMKAALDGLGGVSQPANFSALTTAEQHAWLERCVPFREWLIRNFGREGSTPYSPFIAASTEDVAAVEHVTGRLDSMAAFRKGRQRMTALASLLAELRRLNTALMSEPSPERFRIFFWVSKPRPEGGGARQDVSPDLPFLTPDELRLWRSLIEDAGRLETAIRADVADNPCEDRALFPRDGVSLFAPHSCKRLRDLGPCFAPSRGLSPAGPLYSYYKGGGEGAGQPLPVALAMVKLLTAFPTRVGEEEDPVAAGELPAAP